MTASASAPPGEIITLQFGAAANHAGAHWWNLQDELLGIEAQAEDEATRLAASAFDPTVLWAERRSSTATPSFTPRLLIFEEREGLGGGLGGVSGPGQCPPSTTAAAAAWGGAVTRAVAAPLPSSPWTAALAADDASTAPAAATAAPDLATAAAALSLDGGVTAWPDFLKAAIPPAALAPVAPAWPRRGGSVGWGPPGGEGEAAAADAAAEGVRRLAEACDRLQGITLLVDDTGGWGAAAAAALGAVAEGGAVGGRSPRVVGAVRPAGWWEEAQGRRGAADPDVAARTAAAAASAAFLAPLADVFIPFDLPAGTGGGRAAGGDGSSSSSPAALFRSGAAVAAAWEGLTTPARLVRGGPAAATCTGAADLAALASLVAGPRGHNRWGSVSVGLPAAGAPAAAAAATPPPCPSPSPPFTTTSLSSWTARIPPPDGSRARALLAESVVWRGPTAAGGPSLALAPAATALDTALGAEAAAASRTAAGGTAVRHRCLAVQGLPLPLPWPAGFPAGVPATASSAPLLTRLACVRGVGAARAGAATDLAAAAASSAGRVALGPAGADGDALAEGLEGLRGEGSESDDDGF